MVNIFNEVDEDIRKERYKKLWSTYGKYLIGPEIKPVFRKYN